MRGRRTPASRPDRPDGRPVSSITTWCSIAAAAILVPIIVGAGCSKLNPYRYADRSIAHYLTGYLGPADRYQIHIDRDGTDLFGGYLSHLTVSADELRTKGGLQVRRLDADLYGVRFDRKTRTVRSMNRSAFTASVTTDAANAYLSTHNRGIAGLAVDFEPGTIVVKAAPRALGVSVPVTLRGRAEPEGGDRIRFLPDTMAVSRLSLPHAAIGPVMERVNPIFDLEELRLPARLTSVESREGELALCGEVKLPQ